MKVAVCVFALLLIAGNFVFSQDQPEDKGGNKGACGFNVHGEPAAPSITGPEDIVPLVYVVEQPDSPIEILNVDLQGTWLAISHGQYTEKECAKYRVRNRSDRIIQKFQLELLFRGHAGGSGFDPESTSAIAPGQTMEITGCGGGGHGGAPGDYVRLVISVRAINFSNCFYRPSARIPVSLGIAPGF